MEGPVRTLASAWLGLMLALLASSPTSAQSNRGFTLQRYEPTAAGQWSFWVDHPRFERKATFAAGLTFDYAHKPLVVRLSSRNGATIERSIIRHQLYAHIDLSLSLLQYLELSLTLPALLYEEGRAAIGIEPGSAAIGDPRVGAMVKLYGDPLRDVFAVSAGAQLWIPIGGNDNHVGDRVTRVAPRVSLGGVYKHLLWSTLFQFLYRHEESIGQLQNGAKGNTVGPELQLGAAIGYADFQKHFSVGPEVMLATVITGGHAFERHFTALEILLGGHYRLFDQFLFSLAGGIGALREPGSPDARVIFRVAYAPERHPAPEPPPQVPEAPQPPPPEPDRDGDGLVDLSDRCPDDPQGPTPDLERPGCPRIEPAPLDSDGDGIADAQDQCPNEAGIAEAHGCKPPEPPAAAVIAGDKIELWDSFLFGNDNAQLDQSSLPLVDAVAKVLTEHAEIELVVIEGHTDDRGSQAHNQKLSAARAHAVMAALTARGIAASRLQAVGYGPTRPLVANDTPENRAKNRRVELHIARRTKAD